MDNDNISPEESSYNRIWQAYFDAHPLRSHLAKDGYVSISPVHAAGCKFCRALPGYVTELSKQFTEQVREMGGYTDGEPTCAHGE